jgi:hypothetical protein
LLNACLTPPYAGLDTNAANTLTSTASGITGMHNSTNSTTWFAIPTSHSGLALPPVATPRQSRRSASVYSSSTGEWLQLQAWSVRCLGTSEARALELNAALA